MVQKCTVKGFSDCSEGECNIADSSASSSRTHMLDNLACSYKVYCIVIMLILLRHSCVYCQNFGIKDNILRIETNRLHHDPVGYLGL